MTVEAKIPPSLIRKIRREKKARSEPGFPKMGSTHYLEWLKDLHNELSPELYFEIGTERGASLSLAKCACVAVDPHFKIEAEAIGAKPELYLFQQTSDDFFKSGFLKKLGKPIDLAFLDGMHKIEYLLRDFINIEKSMAADGVVLLHDCIPMSAAAAEREWDRSKTRGWTGDVWKMIPILKEFRPDLKITILDVAPTGIVKIEKLEPRSKVLEKNYQQIIEKFVSLSLNDYGLDKFVNSINLKPIGIPATVAKKNRWENPATPNPSMLRIAIKAPKARPEKINKIVDYAFARGVADALLRKGHSVRIDSGADWYSDTKGTDFDLTIRGRGGFEPQSNIPMISWVIYPGKTKKHLVSQNEVESSEHTFFASSLDLEAFKKRGLGDKCSLLMQGFNKKIMYPKTKSHKDQSDIVLVGSNHFETELRPIVAMALEAKAKLRIFGRGWKNTIASGFLESSYIDNAKVGDLYRSSKIVLCDHLESMRKGGYVSNRIFDVIACGTPIISDDIQGLPDDIRGFVKTVSSSHEFAEAVAEIGAESAQQKNNRQIMAKKMLDHHSFDQRADQISKTLIALKQKKEQASG